MSLAQAKAPSGPDDYLAWEAEQSCRHEYIDGEVLAMSGASDAHGTAALNLAAMLRSALRGIPCKPFIADMKVHVAAANSFYYPDILVTCDPRDRSPEASHVKQHPSLVVEILSLSTEAYDRGNKFAAYRQIEALQEYVLVSLETSAPDPHALRAATTALVSHLKGPTCDSLRRAFVVFSTGPFSRN